VKKAPATKTWVTNLWDDFRTGFWFVPSLLLCAALVLALVLPEIDERVGPAIPDWIGSDTATARATLTAIGGAMITVAGVVFSVTMVTFSLTSSQFGPRLLRSYLSDPISQLALGCCLGSSLYSFLLLRTLHETDDGFFVPHLSVSVAVILSAATVAVLIYFVHHVSTVVQADNVVANVAHDLDRAIDRLFPQEIGEEPRDVRRDVSGDRCAALDDHGLLTSIAAEQEGYLQAIDDHKLLALAKDRNLVMKLDPRPGDFIVKGNTLATVCPADQVTREVADQVKVAFLVGNRRTPRQDVECAVVELVEVAVRALSPGINDPFTAMRCVDRLGASLARLSQRRIPSSYRYDDQNNLRIIVRGWEFGEVLDAAFDMIRQHSAGNVAVTIRLLESLIVIAGHAEREADQMAIHRQARMILEAAQHELLQSDDLGDVAGRYEHLIQVLRMPSGSSPAAAAALARDNADSHSRSQPHAADIDSPGQVH
jgi:uncharacterized membrane protein